MPAIARVCIAFVRLSMTSVGARKGRHMLDRCEDNVQMQEMSQSCAYVLSPVDVVLMIH